MKYLMFLYRL